MCSFIILILQNQFLFLILGEVYVYTFSEKKGFLKKNFSVYLDIICYLDIINVSFHSTFRYNKLLTPSTMCYVLYFIPLKMKLAPKKITLPPPALESSSLKLERS